MECGPFKVEVARGDGGGRACDERQRSRRLEAEAEAALGERGDQVA